MGLEEILERVESFDECTPKSRFTSILNNYPELKKSLNDQLSLDSNQEWIKKAKKGRFFFIIYDDSWKASHKTNLPNSIQLKFIGTKSIPTISIDIHKRPV